MLQFETPTSPLLLTVNGESLMMYPRQFKSGSKGWYLSQKVMIGERRVQLSFSAVVVGSKPPPPLIEVDSTDDLYTVPETSKKAPKKPRASKKAQKASYPPKTSENGQETP